MVYVAKKKVTASQACYCIEHVVVVWGEGGILLLHEGGLLTCTGIVTCALSSVALCSNRSAVRFIAELSYRGVERGCCE
jgi:hypothetical protein